MDENTLIFTFYVVDAHLIRIKKLSAWPSLSKWMFPSLKYTDTKMQIQKYTNAGYSIPKVFAKYI